MKTRRLLWLGAGVLCASALFVYIRRKVPAQPVTKTFSASGVKKVILRASQAQTSTVTISSANTIQISGLPTGGAEGYHSPDPFWREKPAQDWGLDFVAKRYGNVLVISTRHEILYIHHHYGLVNLNIQIPKGVKVIKEEMERNGEGKPNLSKPT